MKLTFVLLVLAFLQVKAEVYAQKVTVTAQNATITDVMAQIRRQTDYDFLYNNQTVKDAKPITITANDVDVKKVLEICFRNQPFGYTIRNKTILIIERPAIAAALQVTDVNLFQKITGVVKDSTTGELLIGVSIVVEGATVGTNTNVQGAFSLDVPGANKVLVFSYIGYETRKMLIKDQTNIEVTMVKTDTKLNEVVVVGYGTRAKGAITGAISTVKSDVFENRPVTNSFDALQGTIPGLTITKASGQPGGGNFDLKVRGNSSINGNSPLILVDGVPGDINTINTNDIAEVTVLKDAAAAIYGARAADGVIIVTTKRGKKGPPEVTYSGNFGIKTPTYLRKIMNTLQYAEFADEGLRNVGIPGFPQEVFDKIKANAPPI